MSRSLQDHLLPRTLAAHICLINGRLAPGTHALPSEGQGTPYFHEKNMASLPSTHSLGRRLLLTLFGTSPLWLGILFFIYGPRNSSTAHQIDLKKLTRYPRNMADMNQATFWNTADMTKLLVPPDVTESAKDVTVQESRVKVQDATVFYREAQAANSAEINILLLHGMRFSSKTWLDLGTIGLLAAMGYRVVAVDLPGYGESPAAKIGDRGVFLHDLIQTLKIKSPVIVSPSMSGAFALPYLLKYWKDMGGYIPVAPIGWEVLEKYKECKTQNPDSFRNVPDPLKTYLKPPIPDLDCIQAPTLVVYGENDRSRSSALLCLLPFSQAAEIPNGAHPAYLTDPDLWHKLLYNFLGHADMYARQKKN